MNAHARPTPQTRPLWPDAPATIDPEAMHPRALEMAERMREGATTFRELTGAGFSAAEIDRFAADARAHAQALAERQVEPGGDLMSEMADKARAAIPMQPPLPRGAPLTQAMLVGWRGYCTAVAAHAIDPHAAQRDRCLSLLTAWFQHHTPAGPAIIRHVISESETMLIRTARSG
ncbi:hypothetical protein [Aquibium oceanicum]|uniref:Uncharacterized protein n=1 Tax=Aquibium oceanicum TaxID=1670800 RepID=A0A1L3SPS7_9HYPH|nr:hypothetical protein [Aquibium oceanicum]APH71416.1 hypothetical protein BSQ44_08585 [Aquibium oceanicum]